MDSSDIRNRERLNRVKISVGLTALAVIVLILLLALTVRHAREKEMVRQFGAQQVAVARGTAARLEDLILVVKKSLLTLAGEPDRSLRDGRKIGAVHAGMEGKISFTAVTDEAGAILMNYPPSVAGRVGGVRGDASLPSRSGRPEKPAVGVLSLPDDAGKHRPGHDRRRAEIPSGRRIRRNDSGSVSADRLRATIPSVRPGKSIRPGFWTGAADSVSSPGIRDRPGRGISGVPAGFGAVAASRGPSGRKGGIRGVPAARGERPSGADDRGLCPDPIRIRGLDRGGRDPL